MAAILSNSVRKNYLNLTTSIFFFNFCACRSPKCSNPLEQEQSICADVLSKKTLCEQIVPNENLDSDCEITLQFQKWDFISLLTCSSLRAACSWNIKWWASPNCKASPKCQIGNLNNAYFKSLSHLHTFVPSESASCLLPFTFGYRLNLANV